MIELNQNQLVVSFPEVHEDAVCSVGFQRTLRIPDDNRDYPLPPGLGSFPLLHIDDYLKNVPETWVQHGGVFMPMYQAEAMWVNFHGSYPMAVKVAAGKIDALTGQIWTDGITEEPQNYMVIPDQPWLDGFSIGKGLIRQFVAMPLGEEYSAEEQLTGKAQHGGLQIAVYPMKASIFEALNERDHEPDVVYSAAPLSSPMEMGLAPGGLMRQEIYEDEYGFDVWDLTSRSRCFVHVLNSIQFYSVTGIEPPISSPTAADYTIAGLPWFEYYGGDAKALAGAMNLAGLDSVAAKKLKQRKDMLEGNDPVQPTKVVKLGKDQVREGDF